MQTGLRHLLREAFLWSAVVLAGFATVYYFGDVLVRVGEDTSALARASGTPAEAPPAVGGGSERTVRLFADARGHFAVNAFINDRPAALLADTGATVVTLTYEDARNVGVMPGEIRFTHRTQTANGIAKVAPVTLDRVRIGDIELRGVRAVVSEPGKLNVSLLGMSFLGALTRFEMRGRELMLVQ